MSLFLAPNPLPFHPNVYRYSTLDAAGKAAFRTLTKLPYDKLDAPAQAVARAAVLSTDVRAYRHNLAQTKDRVKTDLHGLINDGGYLRALVAQKKHLAHLSNDTRVLVGHITANLCDFLPDGSYIVYVL